jgi:hypothetical protein
MESRSESDPMRTATKGLALLIIDPAGAVDGAIVDGCAEIDHTYGKGDASF